MTRTVHPQMAKAVKAVVNEKGPRVRAGQDQVTRAFMRTAIRRMLAERKGHRK